MHTQVCQCTAFDELCTYVTETIPLVVFNYFNSSLALTLLKVQYRGIDAPLISQTPSCVPEVQ